MGAIKKLFKGPKLPEKVRMPDAGDMIGVKEQERQKAAKRASTEGRESTRLSDKDYGGTILQ